MVCNCRMPRPKGWPLRFPKFAVPACLALLALLLPACSILPSFKPKSVGFTATAYSWGAKCNGPWGPKNALGGPLVSGRVNSAASDWSRLPLGTLFRVRGTGKVHLVDDYGSAMVGKNKVDLYKPSYREVDEWGVRRVVLDIVKWGDWEKSWEVLKPRSKYAHVRQMVRALEEMGYGRRG